MGKGKEKKERGGLFSFKVSSVVFRPPLSFLGLLVLALFGEQEEEEEEEEERGMPHHRRPLLPSKRSFSPFGWGEKRMVGGKGGGVESTRPFVCAV